jgi:hypothetical protein
VASYSVYCTGTVLPTRLLFLTVGVRPHTLLCCGAIVGLVLMG